MAGEHYSPAKMAMFALRARMNHEAMLYFSVALASLAGVVMMLHLLRLVAKKMGTAVQLPSALTMINRKVRSITLRKAPALPSMGHGGIIFLYVILNAVLTFGHFDNNNATFLSNFASRTGWLSIANMALVIFLSLKNTPLAFLTAWSYERLNILHQVSAYACIIHVILHASSYSAYFVQAGRPGRLLYTEEIYGMVAGISFVALGVSGAIIRAWWYELFYYLHISFFIVGLAMTGLHQPEMSKKIIIVTLVCGGMWLLDRAVRLCRILLYSVSNEVTLYPLSNGGTRVVLKKPPYGATAGKHCFLWIPKIRSCETHPFTIAATDPVEFVIASYDGFTGDLHRYASKNPGVSLKASVDGSYGTFPNPSDSDEMILVAGGSGASFTFGAALTALKKMKTDAEKHITFIWMVKEQTRLDWFSKHLRTLESDERVSVRLFVTRPPALEMGSGSDSETPVGTPATATVAKADDLEKKGSLSKETQLIIDTEKATPSETDLPSPLEGMTSHVENVPIIYRRPDVEDLIRSSIQETPANKRVLVMGCGPEGLMQCVRDTTASCIRADGPSVELHCEQFGW